MTNGLTNIFVHVMGGGAVLRHGGKNYLDQADARLRVVAGDGGLRKRGGRTLTLMNTKRTTA
jgi:hypothetical protein